MYISIRRYWPKGDRDQLVSLVRDGFVPIIQAQPGFLGYQLVLGKDTVASISTFGTREAALASNKAAAEWVNANLSQFVTSPAEITAGEVVISVGR